MQILPGVSQDYSFDVLFSSGLSDAGEVLHKWVGESTPHVFP